MPLDVLDPGTDTATAARPSDAERGLVAVMVAGLLVVVANRWGTHLLDEGVRLRILAPPLVGRVQLGPDRGVDGFVIFPFVVAAAVVASGPRLAATLPWRRLLLAATAAAGLWAVALALTSGWYWLQRPMELPGHYLHDVGAVGDPFAFLREFTDRIDEYATHVRAHPPGFLLVLWGLDRIGLGGSGWAAALVIAGGAAAVPAVLVTVRDVAGEVLARRAAPFLVLSPVALYVATTADAFFAGLGAWSVACIVLATGRRGRASVRLAAAGGALFAATLMLSYGLVLLAAIPAVVAWSRRRLEPVVVAALTAAACLLAVATTGFWWVEGLFATRVEYLESVASIRPYGFFLFANVAALAIVVGPATIAGGVHRAARPLAPILGGALLAIALANLSGMSKGEVERIWLPFAVWLLPAGAALVGLRDQRTARRWLIAQGSIAVAVQLFVRTHW